MGLVPFTAIPGSTISISVSNVNAQGTLSAFQASRCLLTNSGSTLCYVRIGVGAQTAVTTDLPILPNAAYVVSINDATKGIAAITASGTTTLLATLGEGE